MGTTDSSVSALKYQRFEDTSLMGLANRQAVFALTGSRDVSDEEFARLLHPGKLLLRTDWVEAAGLPIQSMI